jgi:transposase InsO family protein
MADDVSRDSGEGKPKAGGTVDEGVGSEGPEEEGMGQYDGHKAFTVYGGEHVEAGVRRLRTWKEVGARMMVCQNRRSMEEVLFHSDRGVRYRGKEFRAMLSARCPRVGRGMSRKGNRWGNACAERFFKISQEEADKLEGRRAKEVVRVEVFEYMEPYYKAP